MFWKTFENPVSDPHDLGYVFLYLSELFFWLCVKDKLQTLNACFLLT